jgi:2-polyprenyl-6-methoxyphenol hydroxylase-like FAD-dependent oxidoreductase
MREVDILIAGGGLAGSTAAAMLARQGFEIAIVDPHANYPFDLRCEKLIGRQVTILRRTGLADLVLPAGTLDGECWIAQFGRVVLKRPGDQWGILYDTLVNTMRSTIAAGATFIEDKVMHIANGPLRQVVSLAKGEEISTRLVVLANGLNTGLRHSLGMERQDVSKCHCITIAFDV